MKTAKVLIDTMPGMRGQASCFELDPPIVDYYDKKVYFVVVSAANVPLSGNETYIFPSDEKGGIVNWGEMPGSRKGTVSPKGLLKELGYTIIEKES